ncbi:MAG TPA: hypothetical protein VK879_22410 [Candidatus Sulfomarinibacteraceae bacterium]|nr:hypothetical protein [Candidatus Sulfomarinibacteraceae bacterium]
MNRYRLSFLILPLLLLATAATVSAAGNSDLAGVRAATAQFHRVDAAVDAGWDFVASDCVAHPDAGGMGYHYVNLALVDLHIDPAQPEVLVYAPGPNGKLNLVAAEYMVPAPPWDAANSAPPTVLGQPMHYTPHLDAYTLHAWVWQHNPAGMFADWNPTVSCS